MKQITSKIIWKKALMRKMTSKKFMSRKEKKKNNNNPTKIFRKDLSCFWSNFDQTSNVGSWEYLKEISTVTMTFVQATFVLTTFVHIRNISAVTDPILTKL